MGVSIGTADITCAYVGSSPMGAIYAGDTKIRPTAMLIEFLLVGGGGPGGKGTRRGAGGGGGAGGVVYCAEFSFAGSMNVVIGAGGCRIEGNQAATLYDYNYAKPSCFGDIIAYGGGIGGYRGYYNYGLAGASGGGSPNYNTGTGGASCPGQGHDGGSGCGGAGGGGGYCEPGGCGELGSYGGHGLCSDITGQYCRYGSGGGGGGSACNEASYGGGNPATTGCAATSRGGGGGAGTGNNYASGAGCQGIFVVRYPTACNYNISGGCKYTCGDYTIHCFTSDGALTAG